MDNEIFGMLGDSEAEGMALEFVPGEEESMNAPVVRGRPGRSVGQGLPDGSECWHPFNRLNLTVNQG